MIEQKISNDLIKKACVVALSALSFVGCNRGPAPGPGAGIFGEVTGVSTNNESGKSALSFQFKFGSESYKAQVVDGQVPDFAGSWSSNGTNRNIQSLAAELKPGTMVKVPIEYWTGDRFQTRPLFSASNEGVVHANDITILFSK